MLGSQQPFGGGLQLGGGLGQTSQAGGLKLGLGLGQQTQTSGLNLGGGLGLQQQTGTGFQLGQQQQTGTGIGLGLGGGLGLGQQNTSSGRLNFGGLGTGTQSAGLQLGGGGWGLGQQNRPGGLGLGLGGLNLASTQKTSAPSGLGIFGSQQQQLQQQQQQSALQAQLMLNAVKAPGIFPDDRDMIITKFNLLQAYCGTGKGLASHGGIQAQTVDFAPDNPFCRFKTVCYSRLPTSRNEDGLVALQFKKPESDLLVQQDSIVQSLQSIIQSISNTPNVSVVVESVRPLPDNCSEMTIYVLEKSVLGGSRHLLANDVYMALQNATRKPHLEKLGVAELYPKTGFSDENLKLYLQNPPPGINSQLWDQSKKDNPDPQQSIPVPVIGSSSLLKRMKHQEQETRQHQSRLEILATEVEELQRGHATTTARIAQYRRRLIDLSHRVLKVMVVQEALRKSGYSVQPDEEQLRIRLEGIQAELDAPLQFKGRLNELLSQVRMQTQVPGGARQDYRLPMDPVLMEEILQHLHQQQGALSQLVKIVKEDFDDLKCIEEGFAQT